jgi:hypothetical protein
VTVPLYTDPCAAETAVLDVALRASAGSAGVPPPSDTTTAVITTAAAATAEADRILHVRKIERRVDT